MNIGLLCIIIGIGTFFIQPVANRQGIGQMLRWFRMTLFLVGGFLFFAVRSDLPVQPVPHLVPLGTNVLSPGTLLYNRHTMQFWAKVLEVNGDYEFEDGTNRPGVLIKTANGSEWVPRENMKKLLVEH